MNRFPASYQQARAELCEIVEKALGSFAHYLHLPSDEGENCGDPAMLTEGQAQKLRRAFASAGYKSEYCGAHRRAYPSRTNHNVGLTIVEDEGGPRAYLWAFEEGSSAL